MASVSPHADVAELVDALVSGTSVRKNVEVQVLSSAPKQEPHKRGVFICRIINGRLAVGCVYCAEASRIPGRSFEDAR
jgi:hypothetical protein